LPVAKAEIVERFRIDVWPLMSGGAEQLTLSELKRAEAALREAGAALDSLRHSQDTAAGGKAIKTVGRVLAFAGVVTLFGPFATLGAPLSVVGAALEAWNMWREREYALESEWLAERERDLRIAGDALDRRILTLQLESRK